MVAVALDLVVHGVLARVHSRGDITAIGLAVQTVDHRAAERFARRDELLPVPVIGQRLRRRSGLDAGVGLADREGLADCTEDVVAAFLIRDGHGRRAGIDVVPVGNGVLSIRDLRLTVLDGDGRLDLAAVIVGERAAVHDDGRVRHRLRLDGHGEVTGRDVVVLRIHSIVHLMRARVGERRYR